MNDIGNPIKLDVWQITSEYAIIEQHYDDIFIIFRFWDEKQNEVKNKVAILDFSGVWTFRYSKFNKTRYYPNEIEHDLKSYYLEIENSSWLKDLKEKRSKFDSDWDKYDHRNYKHFVFQNNSYYVEIIADKVSFRIDNMQKRYCKYW